MNQEAHGGEVSESFWLASFLRSIWEPMSSFGWGAMEAGKNIRISQLLAVCIVLASVMFIVLMRTKYKQPKFYSDPIVPLPQSIKVGIQKHGE
ncbi:hypothetical protein D3C74_357880 [compost metagenome]